MNYLKHLVSKTGLYWAAYYMLRLFHIDGIVSDYTYLCLQYICCFGKKPNLKNPVTYNEKLLWIKLYDRRDLYTTLVDKYAVKQYVSEKIGSEYVIPLLGVWNSVDDINLESLPKQFVLKTTFSGGSTGVIICRDKGRFDFSLARENLRKSFNTDYYRLSREWPYKNVPHRIIAEEYKEDEYGELRDYKFFCFDGRVEALFVATERSKGDVKFDYFDADFNHLDLYQTHSMSGAVIEKPQNFELMKELASKLSIGLPQARVDLYDVCGKVYFGEITLFHHGGQIPFHPEEWDQIFGSWIKLPLPENQ